SIGGYLNPDYEKIVALQPDIIIMLPNLEMERKLQNLGLRTFTLPDETVEQILHSIKTIGRLLNHEQQAQALVQGIRDTLSWVAEQTTVDDSISTLLIVGREANSLKGLYAAGEDTYLSEILQLCGGTNVFADIDSRYFDVSKEAVIQRNPKAIFELRIIDAHDQSNQVSKLKQDWQQLPILQAVKLNRIYLFTERYFQIPGPRISQIAVAFYQAMHQVNLD
ncbi:MAG: ABC transporter substrate-binding protein, partial [Aliifodinibius sp.]|nr:ABC transporter substrate-binding protein [Fodinibius sp.]NIV13754.1 ABC transporter substrate-binding protein [Fodinibius sp.]NIY27536.1 ABC transporter substrate-binding protein [Fodinibius sp.]